MPVADLRVGQNRVTNIRPSLLPKTTVKLNKIHEGTVSVDLEQQVAQKYDPLKKKNM